MNIKSIIFLGAIFLFFSCSNKSKESQKEIFKDRCTNLHDTTRYLQFTLDTSKDDFYDLLSFIESKNQFNRFDRKNRIDSSTNSKVYLKKLLCEEKFYDSPIENWVLNNIYSIKYRLSSHKPAKGTKDFYAGFEIIQLNFLTQAELEIAFQKIMEVRWGDPLDKWNDWYIVKGNKRIYILECYVAMFSEVTQKYKDIIQKEWVDK